MSKDRQPRVTEEAQRQALYDRFFRLFKTIPQYKPNHTDLKRDREGCEYRKTTLPDGTILDFTHTKAQQNMIPQEPERIHTTVKKQIGDKEELTIFTITPTKGLTQLLFPVSLEIQAGKTVVAVPVDKIDYRRELSRFTPEQKKAFGNFSEPFMNWVQGMVDLKAYQPRPIKLKPK